MTVSGVSIRIRRAMVALIGLGMVACSPSVDKLQARAEAGDAEAYGALTAALRADKSGTDSYARTLNAVASAGAKHPEALAEVIVKSEGQDAWTLFASLKEAPKGKARTRGMIRVYQADTGLASSAEAQLQASLVARPADRAREGSWLALAALIEKQQGRSMVVTYALESLTSGPRVDAEEEEDRAALLRVVQQALARARSDGGGGLWARVVARYGSDGDATAAQAAFPSDERMSFVLLLLKEDRKALAKHLVPPVTSAELASLYELVSKFNSAVESKNDKAIDAAMKDAGARLAGVSLGLKIHGCFVDGYPGKVRLVQVLEHFSMSMLKAEGNAANELTTGGQVTIRQAQAFAFSEYFGKLYTAASDAATAVKSAEPCP